VTLGIQLFASRRRGATVKDVLRDLVSTAVLAEKAGYDVVWLAEHHGTDWNLCTDPLTVLAHLAALTNRIRLGAAVVNLSLHHPVRIAEQAALVNVLSGGRLELGIGRGFAPGDYERFGLDHHDSERLFRVHHEKLIELLGVNAETARIPTWLATTGNRHTLDLAVQHGHGVLVATHGSRLAEITEYVHARIPRPRVALTRAVHVAQTRQAAEHEIRPHLSWYVGQLADLQPGVPPPNVEDVVNSFCILGTAQECRRQMDTLRKEYRVTHLVGVFGIGGMDPAATNRALRAVVAKDPGIVRPTNDDLPTGCQLPHERSSARREHAHGPSQPRW
jgi:alkanesulfonate monooxygenase SsuD/methylene tetrahydromethanopterin reductase-like flavin-dependent oxidoreductase (luciferase family)